MKQLFIMLFALVGLTALAQETITVHSALTGEEEQLPLPENMTFSFDSLLQDWHAKNYLLTPSGDCQMNGEILSYPDSVYIDRLQRMPTVMEMPYNDAVRKLIDMYAGRLRNSVSVMLGAANFYFPLFEEALDAYGLPHELKYLPIIESSLRPTAVSRAGAAGLWQFMLRTGKLYGLESNSLQDDRRDPIKSSYAAARYLKDLYDIFHDWNLVIAAYNCGPGNINKAIHRANGETDYWTIYPFLPKETRGYVPAFIAANYIMNFYCYHNICPMEATLPLATDTVMISRDLHLQQVSEMCEIPMEELRALNPQYKRDIVPGNSGQCTLRLPQAQVLTFIDAGDSIYNHRAAQLLGKRKTVAVKESNGRGGYVDKNATYHKIKSGENLGSIARKYGVTVKQLQNLNGLKGTNITAGKTLRIR